MFNFIEKLRAKPDRVKKRIAFLTSFFLAGIIFVVWLSVIYPDFKKGKELQALTASSSSNPISGLLDIFSNTFSDIGSEFSKMKASIESFSTQPEFFTSTTTSTTTVTTKEEESDPVLE